MEKQKNEMRVKSTSWRMNFEHMRIFSYKIGRRFEKPDVCIDNDVKVFI